MKKDKKIEWIVSLRAFACLAVIMIHVIEGWINDVNIIDDAIYIGGGVCTKQK